MVKSFDDDFDQLLKVSSKFDAFDSYGSIDAFDDFDAFEDLQRHRSTTTRRSIGRSTMNNTYTATSGNHIHHATTKVVHVNASEKLDSRISDTTETYENHSTRSKDLEQWQRQWSEFEGREGQQVLDGAATDIEEDEEDIVTAAVETATVTLSRTFKQRNTSTKTSSSSPSNQRPEVSSSLALREDAPPTPPSPSVPRSTSSNGRYRPNIDNNDEYETMADGRRICQDLSSTISSHSNKEESSSSLARHKHHRHNTYNNRPLSSPIGEDLIVPALTKKDHGDFSSWKRELDTIRREEKGRITDFVDKSSPRLPPSSSMTRTSSIKLAKQHMMRNSVLGDKPGKNYDIKCHSMTGRPDRETLSEESQDRCCCGGGQLDDDDDTDDVGDDCSVLATISVKDDDIIEQWRRTTATPIPDDRMLQRLSQEDSSFSSSPFDEEQCDREIPEPDDNKRSELIAQETTKELHSVQSENNDLFPLLPDKDATKSETDEMALASNLMKKNTEDLAAIKAELGKVKALIQEPQSTKRIDEMALAQNLVKKKTEDLEAIKVELGRVKALIKEPLSPKCESSNGKHKVKRKKKTKKAVKFSSNLITSTYYRPKTLPEEIENLYWDEDELDRWEEDRVNTSPDRIEVTLSTTTSLIRKSTTNSVSKTLAGKEIIGIDNQCTILHCNQYHDDDTVSNVWIDTESIASF